MNLPIVFVKSGPTKFKERDREIFKYQQQGKTLEQIGDIYGLSRERVRQICDYMREKDAPGKAILDPRFKRIANLLGVTHLSDFEKFSYSDILKHNYTSVPMVKDLEEALKEYHIGFKQDIDLNTFQKHKYTPVAKKMKPGPRKKNKDQSEFKKNEIDIEKINENEINALNEYDYLRLGMILHNLEKRPNFAPYNSFKEKLEADYPSMGYSKARQLIKIYMHVSKNGIPTENLQKVSWTKVRAFAHLLNKDNVNAWIEKAEAMNIIELTNEVKNYEQSKQKFFSGFVATTVEFLKEHPNEKFNSKEIAEYILKNYPAEKNRTLKRSKRKLNDNQVIEQWAHGISRDREKIQNLDSKIITIKEGRFLMFLYQENTGQDIQLKNKNKRLENGINNPFQKFYSLINKNDGLVTVLVADLRDAYGVKRLGSKVRNDISLKLNQLGIQHFPESLPENGSESVKLYLIGSSYEQHFDALKLYAEKEMEKNKENDIYLRKIIGASQTTSLKNHDKENLFMRLLKKQ